MDTYLVIYALVMTLLAAGGWYAFVNQKKVNAALAKVTSTASAVTAAVKAPTPPAK